jgi:ParB-like nuclease domain
MKMRGSASNTASTLRTALEAAEAQYESGTKRPEGTAHVDLKPDQITMRPELFQPREFAFGTRVTDTPYVKKLAGQIKLVGELDPITVIRLGDAWVCIDGHHRLAAYKRVKWQGAIKCEWFGGSVREAVDEAVSRNRTVKLEVPKEDRQEQAWKRVLLGWGSKKEIARLCGVSESIVAMMRRVKARAEGSTKEAQEMRGRLAGPLVETTWSLARLAHLHADPPEMDAEKKAGQLARSIRSRLEDRLSKDPAVTARALAIYDPELPEPLRAALSKDDPETDGAEEEIERRKRRPTAALVERREALLREAEEIGVELARREGVSNSDLAWTAAVEAAEGDP